MKHKKVIKKFLPWVEGKLNSKGREEIERHLKECPECQHYFQVMKAILENPDNSSLPQLEADPYLPTRIQSGKVGPVTFPESSPLFAGLRLSVMTALLVIGLSLGAFMGYSAFQPQNGEDSEIVTAYYQAFNQGETLYQLEEILAPENGEAK